MQKGLIPLLLMLIFNGIQGQDFIHESPVINICSKGTYLNAEMKPNYSPVEDNNNMCIPKVNGIPNSAWYTWKIKHPGTIEFLLKPENLEDDLDFEVYVEAAPGDLRMVRCMASGPNIGKNESAECLGVTGMVAHEINIRETLGCDPDKTRFTAPIYTVKGQTYFLRVINFSSNQGFALEIDGTADLLGNYESDFRYQVENKKAFHFKSVLAAASADNFSYKWNFGNSAMPVTSHEPSPTSVYFKSAGEKQIQLETWSPSGCYQQVNQTLLVAENQMLNIQKGNLIAFPNPFAETTNIAIDFESAVLNGAQIKIWDSKGMEVFETQMINENKRQLDLNGLAPGTYILQVAGENIDESIEIVKLNAQGN